MTGSAGIKIWWTTIPKEPTDCDPFRTRKPSQKSPYPSLYRYRAKRDNPGNIAVREANSIKYPNREGVFMASITNQQLDVHDKLLEALGKVDRPSVV